MRTVMLTLAAAACLGLAVPAAAATNRMSAGQSGTSLSTDMLDKAQYASSQKKKGKKKPMAERSSWGG